LNEQLYTTTGSEAFTLFKQDRQAFHVYHEGFQHQVTKWPDNPLDRVIQYVRDRLVSFLCASYYRYVNMLHLIHVSATDQVKADLKEKRQPNRVRLFWLGTNSSATLIIQVFCGDGKAYDE
jgi:hypothetical protein